MNTLSAAVAVVSLFVGALVLFEPRAGAQAPPPAALSPHDIQVVARLVEAPDGFVASVLRSDARWSAMAQSAVAARASRRRTGLTLVIIGGAVMLIGDGIGTAISLSNLGSITSGKLSDSYFIGVGITAAALVVGVALLAPGIFKMVAKSRQEKELRDIWRGSFAVPPMPLPPPPGAWLLETPRPAPSASAPPLALTLLSGTF